MQDGYLIKLEGLADNYTKFLELSDQDQQWLLPLMSRGVQKTIEMLKLISTKELTFEEIADDIDCHQTTVTQKINSLAKGGMPISVGKTAFLHTGRPRKLLKKEVK